MDAGAFRVGLLWAAHEHEDSFVLELRDSGLDVTLIPDFDQARHRAALHSIDLLMIGNRAGDMEGTLACTWLRQEVSTDWIPVILLLEDESDVERRIEGLNRGADDATHAGVSGRELAARARSVLRRSMRGWEIERRFSHERLSLDALDTSVTMAGGSPITLSRVEFEVLWILVRAAPALVTAETIFERLREVDDTMTAARIRRLVRSIRRKLDASFIESFRGWGYRMKL